MALPGIGALGALDIENPYWGADCIQLCTLDSGSGTVVGTGVSAGSGNSGAETSITSGQKFGAGALRLRTDGYYRWGGQSYWNIAAGQDFTIDIWAKAITAPGGTSVRTIFCFNTATAGLSINHYGSDQVQFQVNGNTILSPAGALPIGEWKHLALTRKAGTIRAFVNGIPLGSTISDNAAVSVISSRPRLGSIGGAGFNGDLDELHVQYGTARWTDAFEPLEVPYASTP